MKDFIKYNYPIESCDVSDKERLRAYRSKRSHWLFMLNGDSKHAIWTQIISMLWSDAVFRTANEARLFANSKNRPSSCLNDMLARFIDQGYVATQVLSIRKLTESQWNNPNKKIISLRHLIDDIKSHKSLITREIYISHDGLPYNPEAARQCHYDHVLANAEGGVWCGGLPTSGPDAFDTTEMMHGAFDKLSGKSASGRHRDDVITPDVFERLDGALQESGWKDIVEFGNKFVAHAADEYSRSLLHNGQQGITLNKLSQCHSMICRVTSAIYEKILWQGGHGLFPTPQFNQFEQLDAPYIDTEELEKLREFWDNHVAKVESWNSTNFLTK